MLIGTAGHIDHGKTTLVQALTGVSTDRLPEERRRGITIELGYAYAQPAAGSDATTLAFIDVPGHEKFVPTMLAGAAGIDFVLLVVAADDGVMPQTREHLAIVDLLGIQRGAVAISKCDRVDGDRLQAVKAEVQMLLATTRLASAPLFAVSAQDGSGVEGLRAHLQAVAAGEQPAAKAGGLRLVVDRRFALAGAGAIVTGTVLAGELAVGEQLELVRPGGMARTARVRGLHVNNRAAERGLSGSRCAVNLAGIDYLSIERGDWLLSPGLAAPSTRLDLALKLLPAAGKRGGHDERRLGQWSSVSLHHAGGQAMARLVLLDGALEAGGLAAGTEGLVQAVLDRPLFACSGDRIVIRDGAGRETLGGGVVLDPFPPSRHRRRPQRLALLDSQRAPTLGERLSALVVQAELGVDARQLAICHNLLAPQWEQLLPTAVNVASRDGNWLFSPAHWEALAQRILARLALHHETFADEAGVERERLRRMCAPQLASAVFLACLESLREEGRLARAGSAWHLPDHVLELTASDRALADRVLEDLLAGEFDPPWVRDLAATHTLDEAAVRRLLLRLAARGEVFQVVRDLFYPRATVRALTELVETLALEDGAEGGGRVRAAVLRDRIGGGRKRAIQLLEFFDRVGFTRRVGEGRQRAHLIRGEAPALEDVSG